MAYAKDAIIEAINYNDEILGANPTSAAGKLHSVWGIGSGNYGYGQTAKANVAQDDIISAAEWALIVNSTSTIAGHQNTTPLAYMPAPVAGEVIAFKQNLKDNITLIGTNRLWARAQGTTSTTSTVSTQRWFDKCIFTHTISFTSGDAARYFFNAGGQISLSFSHPGSVAAGRNVDALMAGLGSSCGTITLSAPSTGQTTIAQTVYKGVKKSGGSGTPTTLLEDNGYYALTSTNKSIFKQIATSGTAYYIGSFLEVFVRTNGTQGANGDKGSIITITTTWDEVPNGFTTSTGTTVNCTIKPPSTSTLTNTWGTPTVTGTVLAT